MRRLTTRAQFQAVLAGQIVARTGHFALHYRPHEAAQADAALQQAGRYAKELFPQRGLWLGAMAPKRWARRAVTRNLIKRQIHQVSAQNERLLQPCAHVVRLRAAFDPREFVSAATARLRKAVAAEVAELFQIAARRAAQGGEP